MSEIFRDRTEGALARRQDLLRKRRDELVTMPHAVRRVVVARAARAAASAAAIACGIGMLAVALSPALASRVAHGMPGINPAVISTAVAAAWTLGFIAFAISRGRSEHRFAVAMSTYVLPGDDLDQDIERLSHERPHAVAREMAHRLEVASAVLPVAAAALVMPATLVYIAHALDVRGWPSTAEYEQDLAACGHALLYAGIAGVFVALAMTTRSLRRAGVAPFAALAAFVTGSLAAHSLVVRDIPTVWVLSTISVLTGAIAFITWRLGRERAALEVNDPAAGSELFTIAGAWRSLRGLATQMRAFAGTKGLVAVGAFGALLVCAGGPVTMTKKAAAAAPAPTSTLARSTKVGVPTSVYGHTASYEVEPTTDGRIRVTVTFVDGHPMDVAGLSNLMSLPAGWAAHITLRREIGALPGPLSVTPFPGDDSVVPLHIDGDADLRFTTAACNGARNLTLAFRPENWPAGEATITFLVEPHLELATCELQ